MDRTLSLETPTGPVPTSFIGPDIEILGADCNNNGIYDNFDIINQTSADCNDNDIPDECDIASGYSSDNNSNGIPDECDGPENDCNNNGTPDDLDILFGASFDCNENAIPDECDIADGTSFDVNQNGVPDECDPENTPNRVRVYVPAHNGLAEGQLQVGEPGDIYVEITNDFGLMFSQLTIEFSSENGPALWPEILQSDITWEPWISTHTFNDVLQDAIWPDTTFFFTTLTDNQQLLAPGTTNIFKMTVTPSATGTVHLTSPIYTYNSTEFKTLFTNGTGSTVYPAFVGPDIEIVDADCNENGINDNLDIINQTSADCNENGIPDECDIADGTSLDENSNGIPDECDPTGAVDNHVRIYVPAGNGHGIQEMIVGQSEDIYIEVSLDREDIIVIEITALLQKTGSQDMWAPLVTEDITFLPASDQLSLAHIPFLTCQDGISSDSLHLTMLGTAPASSGIADWIKITVTPTTPGVISFGSESFEYYSSLMSLGFYNNLSTLFTPIFIAEDINVLYDGCCLDAYSGNTNCDQGNLRNLADITRLIDNVYISKTPLCCLEEGNINGDAGGLINLADITRLIDHVYIGKGPTEPCS